MDVHYTTEWNGPSLNHQTEENLSTGDAFTTPLRLADSISCAKWWE